MACRVCRSWRRYPGRIGAGLQVRLLGFDHRLHRVRRGPHTFAYLATALQAAGKSDIDVVVFISQQPGGRLHLAFGNHRARTHAGMHLVTRAIEETGVDENCPLPVQQQCTP